jgi:hypothetical protein
MCRFNRTVTRGLISAGLLCLTAITALLAREKIKLRKLDDLPGHSYKVTEKAIDSHGDGPSIDYRGLLAVSLQSGLGGGMGHPAAASSDEAKEVNMYGFFSLALLSLLAQPATDDIARDLKGNGIVHVQLEGILGSCTRGDGKDATVAASVVAGGGEFLLDLSACQDARERLAAYHKAKVRRAAYIFPARVKVAGRLEFRPVPVVTGEQLAKGEKGHPGLPRPVLVVDSLGLLESDRK